MGLNIWTNALGEPKGQVTILFSNGIGQERKLILTQEEARELQASLSNGPWAFEMPLRSYAWEKPDGGPVHGVAVALESHVYKRLLQSRAEQLQRQGPSIMGVSSFYGLMDLFYDIERTQPMAVLWHESLPEKEEGRKYRVATIVDGAVVLEAEGRLSDE